MLFSAPYPSRPQLQILLAKGDASWWKMLVEGGEEKAYVDILKEAVDAGGWLAGRMLCSTHLIHKGRFMLH